MKDINNNNNEKNNNNFGNNNNVKNNNNINENFNINNNINKIEKTNKRKELVDFVIKKLHLFEYEIIFFWVTFLEEIFPKNLEEKKYYISMLNRICLVLMGYSYNEYKENIKYKEAVFPLLEGLINIFQILIEVKREENGKGEISYYTPRRINTPLQFNFVQLNNNNFNVNNNTLIV